CHVSVVHVFEHGKPVFRHEYYSSIISKHVYLADYSGRSMFFTYFGKYLLLLKSVFKRPEKWRIYWKEIVHEMNEIGVGSLGLIAIISTFVGAVMTMQIAFQLVSDLIPSSVIGQINRDSSILE